MFNDQSMELGALQHIVWSLFSSLGSELHRQGWSCPGSSTTFEDWSDFVFVFLDPFHWSQVHTFTPSDAIHS